MSSRGLDRERKLRAILAEEGWVVIRASMGIVDLVALKTVTPFSLRQLAEVRFVQVKSTAGGPYERFGPSEREQLLHLAQQAGASAWLIWWPPGRQGWRWIGSHEWPLPHLASIPQGR
jgi:Holliday junction resolvase